MDEWSLKKRQEERRVHRAVDCCMLDRRKCKDKICALGLNSPGEASSGEQLPAPRPHASHGDSFGGACKAQKIKAINSRRAELLREQKACAAAERWPSALQPLMP